MPGVPPVPPVLPPMSQQWIAGEERFRERMRRRTLRTLEDADKQEEARRAGQFVADKAMRRASVVLVEEAGNHRNKGDVFRSAVQSSTAAAALLAAVPSTSFELSVDSSGMGGGHHHDHSDDDDDGNSSSSDHDVAAASGTSAAHINATSNVAAVRRGSRRGFRESNEWERSIAGGGGGGGFGPRMSGTDTATDLYFGAASASSHRSLGSDADLTTITDTAALTDLTTKESSRTLSRLRRRNKVPSHSNQKGKTKKSPIKKWLPAYRPRGGGGGSGDHGGDDDYDDYPAEDDDMCDGGSDTGGFGASASAAWMCGVCGQAFPSLESAQKHEDWHLKHVVASLGWADDSTNLNFLASPTAATAMPTTTAKTAAATATTTTNAFLFDRSLRGVPPSRRYRFDSSDSIPHAILPQNRSNRSGRGRSGSHGGGGGGIDNGREDRFYSVRHDRGGEVEEEKAEEGFPPDAAAHPYRRRSRAPSGSSEVRFWDDDRGAGGGGGGGGLDLPPWATPSDIRHTSVGPLDQHRRRLLMLRDQPLPLLAAQAERDYVVLADEALLDVCRRAAPMVLTPTELRAERRLASLARDKRHYDDLLSRALARRTNPTNRFRSDADTLRGKVLNKLLDAYQLMKEGDHLAHTKDRYSGAKGGGSGGGGAGAADALLPHTAATLYVNVLVRNGVQVVRRELERLAREKWEHPDMADHYTRFERFRAYAHANMVKLAGLALASDFTPRRIAIQLSNDLYRLLTPRLKRRGVTIGTEIEYRVGGYFVLAVNINTIDWARLVRTSNRDLRSRKAKWKRDGRHEDEEEERSGRWHVVVVLAAFIRRLLSLSRYDVVDQVFSFLYRFHWIIYLPLCKLAYRSPGIGSAIREFIISSAIDEICYYVNEKGMEMEISVRRAENQASFMLSALREIRADGRELQKRRQESEAQDIGAILGPLLGPAIKADKGPAVEPPGFEVPPNLEYVGLELDIPVGFRRLRWAYLSRKSSFVTEALWKTESKYENITIGDWSKHSDLIGDPNPPPTVNTEDFVGAEFEASYLMPKSAFVSANMSYATSQLIAYNDYCFCVKTRSRNPDAPFGSTFVAWTQFLVIDTGNDSCKLTCSVEAEFPNGPPMVARQIQSGMRAGTGESFILTGETIARYANAFP